MYCYASKPIYLTETDWAPHLFAGKATAKKAPLEYSITPEMVVSKVPLNLPENDFIGGLMSEKLIVAARDQDKAKKEADAFEAYKKREAKARAAKDNFTESLSAAIVKATTKAVKEEVKKASKQKEI